MLHSGAMAVPVPTVRKTDSQGLTHILKETGERAQN